MFITTAHAVRGLRALAVLLLPVALACVDPTGSDYNIISVHSVTTGGAFDPDGFTVILDGDSVGVIDVNDEERWAVHRGIHVVRVDGIAANCHLSSPREATVRGTYSRVEIEASCVPAPELAALHILFAGETGLFTMRADGTDRTRLISGGHLHSPQVSTDGTRLAFIAETLDGWTELWTANVDGTEQIRLVDGSPEDPRWSPDGSEIAYAAVTYTDLVEGFERQLYVTSSDGTRTEQLTDGWSAISARWPSWSPDGSRIVFSTGFDVTIVRRDGTYEGIVAPGTRPVWSRDDWIAYAGPDSESGSIWITSPYDWAVPVGVLATGPGSSPHPHDWSPDGTRLLYTDNSRSGTDIYLLSVYEGTSVRLTGDGRSSTPVFWPSGNQ